ncbi:hypothetical protein Acr_07g0013080 [Actinidia rufa]|uniref:RNase H type-1 domain-containing protein n=1 Tax=Actinidia rufa TaxID=165716 RepID=A0A7J0EXF7_9ERIC|nr:hypothetical protein Acr_07g0013080 [Actinidia rufa]
MAFGFKEKQIFAIADDVHVQSDEPALIGASPEALNSSCDQSIAITALLRCPAWNTPPPYPIKIACLPYLEGFLSSTVATGVCTSMWHDSLRHLVLFVPIKNLRLREFSKSLTERAYAWYANLTPGCCFYDHNGITGDVRLPVTEERSSQGYKRRRDYDTLPRHYPTSSMKLKLSWTSWSKMAKSGCPMLTGSHQEEINRTPDIKIAKRELEVPEKDQEVDKDPLPRPDKGKEQVMMLSCYEADEHSTKFKWFFDSLRFSPEARYEATKAIVEISNKYGDYNMSTTEPFAKEMRNAPAIISFFEKDHRVPYKHDIPLYVIVIVNGVEFKCAFLNGGKMRSATKFHVVDAPASYHLLLTRIWTREYGAYPPPLTKSGKQFGDKVPPTAMEVEMEEIKATPDCVQDEPKPQKQELDEVDLAPREPLRRQVFVAKDLEDNEKQSAQGLQGSIRESINNEPVMELIEDEWSLSFDGASAEIRGGVGIVLNKMEGERIDLSYKLDFKVLSNEAEYEALILGLLATLNIGISCLCIKGDSKLVVKQTTGDYALKEPGLASYRVIVQKLMEQFNAVTIQHMPKSDNTYPLMRWQLWLPKQMLKESRLLLKSSRELCLAQSPFNMEKEEEDWQTDIEKELRE